MKAINKNQNNFNAKRLVAATIPSYIFPAVMSFIPGYLLNKPDLMQASYTTIAVSSLLSSLLTFILLWRMEVTQKYPSNKIVRTLLMAFIMVSLGILTIYAFGLQTEALNILPSTFLGAVVTTLTQTMTKLKSKYE